MGTISSQSDNRLQAEDQSSSTKMSSSVNRQASNEKSADEKIIVTSENPSNAEPHGIADALSGYDSETSTCSKSSQKMQARTPNSKMRETSSSNRRKSLDGGKKAHSSPYAKKNVIHMLNPPSICVSCSKDLKKSLKTCTFCLKTGSVTITCTECGTVMQVQKALKLKI